MNPKSLKEVQKALAQVERKRAALTQSDKNGNDAVFIPEDIRALEEASVALRHLERSLIGKESDQTGKELKNSADQLLELAKKMRQRSKRLSATAKTLGRINNTLRQALTILEKSVF